MKYATFLLFISIFRIEGLKPRSFNVPVTLKKLITIVGTIGYLNFNYGKAFAGTPNLISIN